MNETAKARTLLVLCLLLASAMASCSRPADNPPLAGASIGGPFTLVAQDGRTVSNRDFAGKYRIVYFGFTHCPDVCPTDLLQIGQGLKRFEESQPAAAARVQPIFITVDAERDTPAELKPFVAAFHPRMIGLTGTPQQIAIVAKRFGIPYEKVPSGGSDSYSVNHSRIAYLFGPKGEPIAIVPSDQGAAAVAATLERWVR